MKIRKINISSFGKLNDFQIEPCSGLNIIYAPNESGKTTLLSFLKYIFYGIKQKKQPGDLSFKERYISWDSSSVSGSCEIETDDVSYIIQRTDGEYGSKLSVFNLESGETRKDISNPGSFFMKIGERAFTDSCFISNIQSISDSSSDGELISVLTDSYDDKSTYSKIHKELTERHLQIVSDKRKSSAVSVLNNEISQRNERLITIKNQISYLESEIENLNLCKKELANLNDETDRLNYQLKLIECDELISEKNSLSDEKNKLKKALESFEKNAVATQNILNDDEKKLLSSDFSEYKSNMSDCRFISFKTGIQLILLAFVSVLVSISGIYFKPPVLFLLSPLLLITLFSAKRFIRLKNEYKNLFNEYNRNIELQKKIMSKYGLRNMNECAIFVLSQRNIDDAFHASNEQKMYLIKHVEQIEQMINKLDTKINALKSIIPESVIFDSQNIKIFTKRDINDIIETNSKKIAKLSQSITRGFHFEYELQNCKSELVLIENDLERLKTEKKEAFLKAEEIELAMLILDRAFCEAKSSFFPELSRKTEEIFSFITDDRECRVSSNDKFELFVSKSDFIRDARYLSKGTLDILYFSLRIAIIEIMGKDGVMLPLFLDDVFANCDDERAHRLMMVLLKLSQKHQIFLCTCRAREGDYFKENKDVNIFTMQKG